MTTPFYLEDDPVEESTIAGHRFADTSVGRRCIGLNGDGVTCGRSWLAIRDSTEADVGRTGIAHVGALNTSELNSIVEARKREEAAVWEAVSYAASAGSR